MHTFHSFLRRESDLLMGNCLQLQCIAKFIYHMLYWYIKLKKSIYVIAYKESVTNNYLFFVFGPQPGVAQGLLLVLQLRTAPGRLKGPDWTSGIKLGMAT